MRILVTGSRYATEEHLPELHAFLWQAVGHLSTRDLLDCTLVHGNAPGVDRLCERVVTCWAWPMRVEAHDAQNFGPWPAAGPKRNAHMVSLGANACLGFALPGSRGTWDCARKAADAGIPTIVRTLSRPYVRSSP